MTFARKYYILGKRKAWFRLYLHASYHGEYQ